MTSLTTAAGMTAGEKSTSRPPSGSGRMADGRRRSPSNKRCRSDRLASSGYAFRYPTFREGFGTLLDS